MGSKQYVQPLKKLGFRPFRIPQSTADLFETTLQEFSLTGKFRFPPQEGAEFDSWPSVYRDSYFKIEDIARESYFGLLSELRALQGQGEVELSDCLDNHDITFESSFMNIFNYKHGFLKPHRDRCLVTIVYRQYMDAVVGPSNMTESDLSRPNTKTLWSHDINFEASDNKSHWINVDNSLCTERNQACMFIGEEMSLLCGHYLTANVHCVTENPKLPYISQNSSEADRMSLALVLSSPAISKYIEENNKIKKT